MKTLKTTFVRRAILVASLLCPALATAQTQGDGARTYWKTLAGAQALTFWNLDISGNANPADAGHLVRPNTDFEAHMGLLGYTIMLPVAGRSGSASLLLPVGRISAEITGVPGAAQFASRGYGDPMLQFDVNLFGAPAIMSLKDALRYEPRFTMDVMAAVAFPVGEYHSDQPVNLGQNRWYGRVGLPMVLFIGPSGIPGERNTIEFNPHVWLFGENDEYFATPATTTTQKTDPLFALEGHVTHDFTEAIWASLDLMSFQGGKSEIGGVEGDRISSFSTGLTFGAKVSDNVMLNASYMSTLNDNDPTKLSADEFRLSLTYGWHPLIEGMHRLGGH